MRWNCKLGQVAPITVKLGSLQGGGGSSPILRLRVVRVYILLYCIKGKDGRCEFLSEKQCEKRNVLEGRERKTQQIYNEVQQRMAEEDDKERKTRKRRVREVDLEGVDDGVELYNLLTDSGDPSLQVIWDYTFFKFRLGKHSK